MDQDTIIRSLEASHNQIECAEVYAIALRWIPLDAGPDVWCAINAPLLRRYKPSGFARVKEMAWKIVQSLPPPLGADPKQP